MKISTVVEYKHSTSTHLLEKYKKISTVVEGNDYLDCGRLKNIEISTVVEIILNLEKYALEIYKNLYCGRVTSGKIEVSCQLKVLL